MQEEVLNIEMVWEIIDWYKDSILKVRDMDLKQEAISLSRIGKVYDKVLKIKFRARDYLKKSMELAHSIVPFVVTNEGKMIWCILQVIVFMCFVRLYVVKSSISFKGMDKLQYI